jgi:hypothetical protein
MTEIVHALLLALHAGRLDWRSLEGKALLAAAVALGVSLCVVLAGSLVSRRRR